MLFPLRQPARKAPASRGRLRLLSLGRLIGAGTEMHDVVLVGTGLAGWRDVILLALSRRSVAAPGGQAACRGLPA